MEGMDRGHWSKAPKNFPKTLKFLSYTDYNTGGCREVSLEAGIYGGLPGPNSIQIDVVELLHHLGDLGPVILRKALEDGLTTS